MAWVSGGKTRRPVGSGRFAGAELLVLCEEEENDIDKTLAWSDITAQVAGAKAAEVLWVFVDYTGHATTAGNRQLRIDFRDSSDDVIGSVGGADQSTVGATENALWMFGAGLEAVNSDTATPAHERLPDGLVLAEGQSLRVFEYGIEEDLDEMIVHTMLAVYT